MLLFFCVGAHSQPTETTIKIQAMDMARAVLAKDVNKLVSYMPPKLVAQAGGKEKLLAARDTLNKYMQQFGAEIKKVTIGNPGSIVIYKNQWQAIVPQTTEMTVMSGRFIFESSLVAISEDKGRHWYFVDTSVYRGEKLKSVLPDLSPQLVIPPAKPPRVVTDP